MDQLNALCRLEARRNPIFIECMVHCPDHVRSGRPDLCAGRGFRQGDRRA